MMPPPDPETARQAVSDVLSDDRFDWTKAKKVPGWVERIGKWIVDFFRWLADLFSPGDRRPPRVDASGIGVVAKVVIVLVLAAAIGLLWWAFLRWRARRPAKRKRDKGADVEVGEADDLTEFTDRTEEEWAAEAEMASAAGSDVNAIRAHYGRAVVAVISARWAGDNPGRTSGELARDVHTNSPEYGPTFSSLTRTFEDAWFGHRPVDADTVDRMARAADDLVASAGLGRGVDAVAIVGGRG